MEINANERKIITDLGNVCYMSINKVFPKFSLRSVDKYQYHIYTDKTGKTKAIDSIGCSTALYFLYVGAIYNYQGRTYIVKELDTDKHNAYVEQIHPPPYYTISRDIIDIYTYIPTISTHNNCINTGRCTVERYVYGYQKIDFRTNKIIEVISEEYPKVLLPTDAVWIVTPASV